MAFAEAARSLAARGFRVHPLRAGSKVALVDRWPQKATTDPTQIDAWWSKWPDANIGIATGLGLTVVDLDGDEGVESWSNLTKDNDTPPTLAVKTPRGWHFYFAADGVSNSANRLGQHVDVRGDGGYVVGPGSIVDGKEYVEHEGHIATAPPWLVSMARGESVSSSSEKLPRPTFEPAETYGEGERNDGLFRLASSLRARGLEPSELLAALLEANRQRCSPPLDDAEVRLIASSASRFERGETAAVIIHNGQLPKSESADEDIILTPADQIDMQPVEMAWDARLPRGMISLIVGEAGEGKSTLTHYIAAQLSRGTLAGCYEGRPVNVAIASAEDVWSATIAPRLLALGADLSRVMRIEAPDHDDISLDGGTGYVDKVRSALGASQIELLIIDTIVAHITTAKDTYKEQHVREVLKPWKRLCEETGLTLLGVMHLNRRESRETLTRIAGSGGFGGKARSVLLFGRDPEDGDDTALRYIAHAKCNVAVKAVTLRLRIVSATVGARHMPTSVLSIEGEAPEMTDDRLLGKRKSSEDRTKISVAEEFLRDQLAGGKEVLYDKLLASADQSIDASVTTLNDAAKRLGVSKRRAGFPSRTMWRLPEVATPADESAPF